MTSNAQLLLKKTSSTVILDLYKRIAFVWIPFNFFYVYILVGFYGFLFSSAIDSRTWAVRTGESSMTIFVLSSLLSVVFASDWALTLNNREFLPRILSGILVCTCFSAVFAITAVGLLQRGFSEYPLFVLICHATCVGVFVGYIKLESNQVILKPAPVDMTHEFMKILRRSFSADLQSFFHAAFIKESLTLSGISTTIFALFQLMNFFQMHENKYFVLASY